MISKLENFFDLYCYMAFRIVCKHGGKLYSFILFTSYIYIEFSLHSNAETSTFLRRSTRITETPVKYNLDGRGSTASS